MVIEAILQENQIQPHQVPACTSACVLIGQLPVGMSFFQTGHFSSIRWTEFTPYEISMRVDHTFTIILIIRDERLKMYLYCVHLSMYVVLRKWNLLRSDLP